LETVVKYKKKVRNKVHFPPSLVSRCQR